LSDLGYSFEAPRSAGEGDHHSYCSRPSARGAYDALHFDVSLAHEDLRRSAIASVRWLGLPNEDERFDSLYQEPDAPRTVVAPDRGADETRTTVMIRSLPANFTRQLLEDVMNAEGFVGCYDFIYVPADIASGACFFYAFVNLISPPEAQRFRRCFTGFARWPVPGSAEAAVDWSEALQGLEALIERYRNSPLMHEKVPSSMRPAIYHSGRLAHFPPPTARIKAPRLRRAQKAEKVERPSRLEGFGPASMASFQ